MPVRRAKFRIPILLGLMSFLAVAPCGGLMAQAPDSPDLTGEWIIDLDESDDPAEVLDAIRARRSANTGVGVGVGIYGIPVELGRSGGRGVEPGEVMQQDLRRLPRHLTALVDRIDVEQSPDGMRVDYGGLVTATYRSGETTEDGEEMRLAEWRRDVYTVVREIAGGPRATEEIYLDRSDPSRLRWFVTIELSSRRGRTVRFNRIYDRRQSPEPVPDGLVLDDLDLN